MSFYSDMFKKLSRNEIVIRFLKLSWSTCKLKVQTFTSRYLEVVNKLKIL